MKRLLFVFLTCGIFANAQAQHWSELMNKPIPNYFEVKAAFDKEWKDKPYEKGQGVSLFFRWEKFMLTHMDRNGDYDPSRQNVVAQGASNLRTANAGGNWSLIGPEYTPTPDGYNNDGIGRVKDIAFHPTDTTLFYVASASGGVWKTTDEGNTYSYLSQDWPSNSIKAIDINENNPNELWVALTNKYLMHTTDGGNTWTSHFCPGVSNLRTMVFNQATGKVIIGNLFGDAHSSSDGNNWTQITSLDGVKVDEFLIHPGNSSLVYASSISGLFKSTNGGADFSQVTTSGIDWGTTTNRIAVSQSEPNSLWVLAVSSSRIGGVYKSTNQGNSFVTLLEPDTQIEYPNNILTANQYFGGQGWIHAALGVSDVDPNFVFVGGVGTFFTQDAGANWTAGDAGWADESPHVDHLNIRFQPDRNWPYSCDDGGVYKGLKPRSSSGHFIWKPLNEGLSITEMYNLSVSHGGDRMITGQQDNGSYFYDVENGEWSFLVIGDGMANGFNPSNPEVSYVANQNGSLFRTESHNGSYNKVSGLDAIPEASQFYTEFHADENQAGVLYQLRTNLWRSQDEGQNWSNLTESLSADFQYGKIVFSRNNPEVIGIFSTQDGLFVSQDNGQNWESINLPLDQWNKPVWVQAAALHSTDQNTMWVYNGRNTFVTTDKGSSWSEYTSWSTISISKLVHVDGTTDELLVATDNGVLIKEDGSTNLVEFGAGLPKVSVRDLEVNYCTDKVYIATYGRGVWASPISLSASACCKVAPTFASTSAKFLCSDGATLSVDGPASGIIWSKDDVVIASNQSSISVDEGGQYEVYSSNAGCQSATASLNLQDVTSENLGFDIDFESGVIADNIMILKDHSADPFTLSSAPVCDSSDLQFLSFSDENGSVNWDMEVVEFVLPEADLSYGDTASLNFDVATLKPGFSNQGTNIKVLVSENCGVSYEEIFYGTKNDIATVGSTLDISDCNNWKSFSIDLNDYLGKKLLMKVQFTSQETGGQSWWGSTMYLDNFRITGDLGTKPVLSTSQPEDLKVLAYPNPVVNILTVEAPNEIQSMTVYTSLGSPVEVRTRPNQVDTSKLPQGDYILKVQTDKEVYTLHFVKMK